MRYLRGSFARLHVMILNCFITKRLGELQTGKILIISKLHFQVFTFEFSLPSSSSDSSPVRCKPGTPMRSTSDTSPLRNKPPVTPQRTVPSSSTEYRRSLSSPAGKTQSNNLQESPSAGNRTRHTTRSVTCPGERGTPVLAGGVPSPGWGDTPVYPSQDWGTPRNDLGPETWERTCDWDTHQVWTDQQTENITFPHPSDAGSNKKVLLCGSKRRIMCGVASPGGGRWWVYPCPLWEWYPCLAWYPPVTWLWIRPRVPLPPLLTDRHLWKLCTHAAKTSECILLTSVAGFRRLFIPCKWRTSLCGSLPTASEGWGKVIFSVCPHLGGCLPGIPPGQVRMGGTPVGGHLPGVPPWPGQDSGVPQPGTHLPRVPPGPVRTGDTPARGTPARDTPLPRSGWGYPNQGVPTWITHWPGQDGGYPSQGHAYLGYPLARSGWGVPKPGGTHPG